MKQWGYAFVFGLDLRYISRSTPLALYVFGTRPWSRYFLYVVLIFELFRIGKREEMWSASMKIMFFWNIYLCSLSINLLPPHFCTTNHVLHEFYLGLLELRCSALCRRLRLLDLQEFCCVCCGWLLTKNGFIVQRNIQSQCLTQVSIGRDGYNLF